jgi:hypothetical protein
MLKFKQHNQLNELWITDVFKSILTKIRGAFSSLSFGKKVSVKIDMPNLQEAIDLKSRLGYLSEYATGAALAHLIHGKGLRLTARSDHKQMMNLYVKKRKEIEALGAEKSEIDRMEHAGYNMSNQIWTDIMTNGEDLELLTFDIELTGDSAKGESKADLILTITKDSEQQIVDRVVASLKAYKSGTINLSNSTFVSLMKTLFYDSTDNLPKNTEEFIVRFAKDYGSVADMRKLYDLQNIIGTKMKAGKSKEDARAIAKTTHGEVIEIIAKIFKTYYPKHKTEINERVLKMLGLDGDDDFYAAIGEAGKQKVISSRHSKELQGMIKKLSAGFILTVERNGTTNNANILFKSPKGDVIINKLNITFADTGGASPQGKTNAFMNFGPYLK